MLATYGHYLSEVEHKWEGDRLIFSGKAKGMKAHGTVDVTENEVIIDGKLPLLVSTKTSVPGIGLRRSAHSLALRSGPTRLNFASSPSRDVP